MDGSTVCLSALVTVINGAKNIHVQGFAWTHDVISLRYFALKLLGPM